MSLISTFKVKLAERKVIKADLKELAQLRKRLRRFQDDIMFCYNNGIKKYSMEYCLELQYILDDFYQIKTRNDTIKRTLNSISIMRDKIKARDEGDVDPEPLVFASEIELIIRNTY